nr:MAG TPA: hypothetical protein [Caudoviricetes sp.]
MIVVELPMLASRLDSTIDSRHIVVAICTVVVHSRGTDRIIIIKNLTETARVDNTNTSLNRLELDELEALKCRDSRQLHIHGITNLVRNVELVIKQLIDNAVRITRIQRNDQVVVVTHLARRDEVVYALLARNNRTLEIELDRTNARRSLIDILRRSDLTDEIRTANDRDRHVLIIQDLEHCSHIAVKLVHEHSLTPGDRVMQEVRRRCEVERTRDLLRLRKTIEALIILKMNLVILVVLESEVHDRHDLRNLINLIKGIDVLHFLRADRRREMRSLCNLEDLGLSRPLRVAGLEHSTRNVHNGMNLNTKYIRIRAHDHELVLLHVASDRTLNESSLIPSSSLVKDSLEATDAREIKIIVGRDELNSIDRANSLNNCTRTSLLSTMLVNILNTRSNELVDNNTADVRTDREITNTAEVRTNDIGRLILRKSKNNLLVRNRVCNRIMNLVLLQEDIDFLAIRIDKRTGLKRHRELRGTSNIVRKRLCKCAVEQKVLMHRERQADNRVERTKRSVLLDCLTVVLKKLRHTIFSFLNSSRITLKGRVIRVITVLNEEATESLFRTVMHKELTGLGVHVKTVLRKHALCYINKILSERMHRVICITAVDCCNLLTLASTNDWHYNSSFGK